MAITRRWQAGFESNTTSSCSEFTGGVNCGCSNAQAKTGTYSMYVSALGTNAYGYVTLPATRQIRASFHVWSGAAASVGDTPTLFEVEDGATNTLFDIRGNDADDLLLYVAGALQGTALNARIDENWFHLGVDCKIDAAAGWIYVYLNGAEILSFAGNTGNADIGNVDFGVTSGAGVNWAGTTYWDDCYIDDTTGEAAATVVPDRRFAYVIANGNGNYSQCTGQDADSVDNYLNVDDNPHDSDTTYNEADALDERDTYAMTTYAVPGGYTIQAVIPVTYAKKSDAGTDTEIAHTIRDGGVDSDGSAMDAATSYTYQWTRFTTKPSGGQWTQAAVDSMECGFIGKGTF